MSKTDSLFNRFSKRFAGKDSLDTDLRKYMEFYYPSTSKTTYEVLFPWGTYVITTEDPLSAEVHEDSKPYQGYITFRPIVTNSSDQLQPSLFVITPEGEVWENPSGEGIQKEKQRKEIVTEEHGSGIMTSTTTITSVSEPVIDHFKTNKDQWHRYGNLEILKGKTRLTLTHE